jgi:modulator of FtsH protease HflK
MQNVLGSTTKIIVDQKAGGNLLYLPLDKLMQMTGQGGTDPAARVPDPTPAQVQEQAAQQPSRREGMRSREREAGR